MSVVGIDFGNQNCLIAVARKAGIDVIANEVSNRETPSYVGFGAKERFLGEQGLGQEVMNFKNTISNLKRVIGRKWTENGLQQELKNMNVKAKPTENGDWEFEVMYQNEVHSFSPERVTAMLLGKLKRITEVELKTSVVDCVLSVPGYFTDAQRRALLNAAEIAGLNPLRLMNELTATALSYGLFKTDLKEEEPANVMFVDLGQSALSVGIYAFTKNKLKALSVAYEPDFGCREYDRLLTNRFAEIFKKSPGIDVLNAPRAKLRLGLALEKLKKVLSANAEAILNIECLLDDKDVKAKVKREEFLEWTGELNARLLEPVKRALEEAKLTPQQLFAVEIVGGGSRMPVFQKSLSEFLGREVSRTMNSSESVCRGCALQCAILSPTIRVRDFKVEDFTIYPIRVSWKSLSGKSGEGESMEVETSNSETTNNTTFLDIFPKYSPIPAVKQITFGRKESLEISVAYAPDTLPSDVPQHLAKFILPAIPQPKKEAESAKIQVKLKLNAHSLIAVESAQFLETIEEEVVVEEKKPAATSPPAGTEPAPPKENETSNTEGAQPAPETPPAQAQEEKKEVKKEKRKKVIKSDLPYNSEINAGLPAKSVSKFAEEEGKMRSSDKLAEETADRKNALESYILNMRKRLDADLLEFATEEERSSFQKQLTDAEDWLYADGDDATKSAYVEKTTELMKLGNPIEGRKKEDVATDEANAEIASLASNYKSILNNEKYEHIDAAEKDKIRAQCDATVKASEELIAKKKPQPKHGNPAVTVAEFLTKKKDLEKFCNEILSKPKPIPKTEPKPEEKKEEKPAENKGSAAGAGGAGAEPPKTEAPKADANGMDVEGK